MVFKRKKIEEIRNTVNSTIKLLADGLVEEDARYEVVASGEADSTMTKIWVRDHWLKSDVHFLLGGNDNAPCPAEYLLSAFVACIRASYVIHASRIGIDIQSIEVKGAGVSNRRGTLGLDEAIPAGFMEIEYRVIIETEEPEDKIQKLLQFVEDHCHVLNTLRRPLDIKGQVEIKKQRLD